MYLKTEDLAKMGQFFLQKGKWNDKQLLLESWIEEATTSKIASLPAGMRPENLKMKPKDSDWLQATVTRCGVAAITPFVPMEPMDNTLLYCPSKMR